MTCRASSSSVLLDLRVLDRLRDLGLRVDVLGDEQRLEREGVAFARTRQRLSRPARTKRPSAAVCVSRIASSRRTYGRRCAAFEPGTR